MTTTDNFEEPNEEDALEGEPTVQEIVEFSIAVALDLENNLDEEDNPFEQVLNLNINAGQLLYMCYLLRDMYQTLEDMSEDDMEMLENYVRAKKRSPFNSNTQH